MSTQPGNIDLAALSLLIESHRAGNAEAGEHLCLIILPAVRLAAAQFLGDQGAEVDDVVQESMIVWLRYLNDDKGFGGDAVRLAIVIARNRCRDILRQRQRRIQVDIEPLEARLADPQCSALDDLEARELREILQTSLTKISHACRNLLHALYVEDITPEELRVRAGLESVHGIYYRRGVCLGHLKKILQRHLRFGSTGSKPHMGERERRKGNPPA